MGKHRERHYAERIGWLRAAVLGADRFNGQLGAGRVTVWGALAMAATVVIGTILGGVA